MGNYVVAKTKFWKFMREYQKEKRANVVKNFDIQMRWYARTGPVNSSCELRDTHLARAVSRVFNGMAGQHRASFGNIQVIRTCSKPAKDCTRPTTKQFHNNNIRFPLIHRVRKPSKSKRADTVARAPQTF